MSNQDTQIYNRFQLGDELYADNVFQYINARDSKNHDDSVLIARLQSSLLEDSALVEVLAKYYQQIQQVKIKSVPEVLLVIKSAADGFSVVFKQPEGERLSSIPADEITTINPQFISQICESIHFLNRRKIYHGHLRKEDVWLSKNNVQITGFGYGLLFAHGVGEDIEHRAPELSAGQNLDDRAEVYSLARFFYDLFGESNSAIEKALDPNPENRYPRVREFESAYTQAGRKPEKTGVLPIGTVKPKENEYIVDEPLHSKAADDSAKDKTVVEKSLPRSTDVEKSDIPSNQYLFKLEEFSEFNLTPENLLKPIKEEFESIVIITGDAINTLNSILMDPGFSIQWQKVNTNPVADLNILRLLKLTKSYQKRNFSSLNRIMQLNIVLLNRLLLQNRYPSICPILHIYTITQPSVIAGFFNRASIATVVLAILGSAAAFFYFTDKAPTVDVPKMVELRSGQYEQPAYLKRYFGKFTRNSVSIGRNYYIQANEVTVGDFNKYFNTLDTALKTRIGDSWQKDLHGKLYPENRPIDNVNQIQALAYAKWLSARTGFNFQLPSVDQWLAAVSVHAEKRPVLNSVDNKPEMVVSTEIGNLIGNHREWSSQNCADNSFYLLGEDYFSGNKQYGEFPCVSATEKIPATGFRLVRVE